MRKQDCAIFVGRYAVRKSRGSVSSYIANRGVDCENMSAGVTCSFSTWLHMWYKFSSTRRV